jgi:hypothetical protein
MTLSIANFMYCQQPYGCHVHVTYNRELEGMNGLWPAAA